MADPTDGDEGATTSAPVESDGSSLGADPPDPTPGLRRVVLAASFAFPGTSGSPLLQMDAVESLLRHGVEVTVVRYVGRRPLGTVRRRWRGVEVLDVPLAGAPGVVGSLLRRRRPDVLYAHGVLGAELVAPAALAGRTPLVLELHAGAAALAGPAPGGLASLAPHRLATAMVRRATARTIVLSGVERDALVGGGWAAPERVEVLYPPVPDAMRSTLDPPPDAPSAEGPPTIGYVGSYQRWQGVDQLLEAMERVWRHHPDAVVHLWGADEADRQALAPAIAAASGQVVVGGRVERDQILPLLRSFTVAVIPRPDVAVNATTSRKLGEFLLSGRPVVATDVADHRALLGGGAGVVVAPTADGVADGLVEVLDDPAAAEAVGRAGAALAEARFGAATVEARRIELLTQAAAGSRRRPRAAT